MIKILHRDRAGDPGAAHRFLQEARTATQIKHSNVAILYDYSQLPDGSFYMVWEHIEGEDVGQRLRRDGPLPVAVAVELAIQALRGLGAIHAAGVIHRDVSPDNLMIRGDGRGRFLLKIIDLGLAKDLAAAANFEITQAGMFVGKLRYCSPEQARASEGVSIDHRSDLYSLGAVLYEMICGLPPYDSESQHGFVLKRLSEDPLPLRTRNPAVRVPRELDQVVERAPGARSRGALPRRGGVHPRPGTGRRHAARRGDPRGASRASAAATIARQDGPRPRPRQGAVAGGEARPPGADRPGGEEGRGPAAPGRRDALAGRRRSPRRRLCSRVTWRRGSMPWRSSHSRPCSSSSRGIRAAPTTRAAWPSSATSPGAASAPRKPWRRAAMRCCAATCRWRVRSSKRPRPRTSPATPRRGCGTSSPRPRRARRGRASTRATGGASRRCSKPGRSRRRSACCARSRPWRRTR